MKRVSPSARWAIARRIRPRDILTLDSRALGSRDDRLDELVGDVLGIAVLDGLDEVLTVHLVSRSVGKGIDGNLDSVPSLVSVHSVVSTRDGADLSDTNLLDVVLELLQVLGRGPGSSVSSVTEEVNVDVFDLVVLGSSEQGKEVLDVGVNTTVRNETEEVQTGSVGSGVLHRVDDGGLLLELVLLDGWTWATQLGKRL
jgi:hypothetical protein